MVIYLQVTTRCNMSCKHCCFSCGPKGEDMDVKKALKMIQPFMDSTGLEGVYLRLSVAGNHP